LFTPEQTDCRSARLPCDARAYSAHPSRHPFKKYVRPLPRPALGGLILYEVPRSGLWHKKAAGGIPTGGGPARACRAGSAARLARLVVGLVVGFALWGFRRRLGHTGRIGTGHALFQPLFELALPRVASGLFLDRLVFHVRASATAVVGASR